MFNAHIISYKNGKNYIIVNLIHFCPLLFGCDLTSDAKERKDKIKNELQTEIRQIEVEESDEVFVDTDEPHNHHLNTTFAKNNGQSIYICISRQDTGTNLEGDFLLSSF